MKTRSFRSVPSLPPAGHHLRDPPPRRGLRPARLPVPALPSLPVIPVLVALTLFLAADSVANLAAQEPGIIQGRITNVSSGQPLGFALVTVLDPEGREVSTSLTNSAGYYTARLPRGTYRLSVSASGYGTQETGRVRVVNGQELVGIDFSLSRQAVELAPLVVSVGRTYEQAIGAPAHVETVPQARIRRAPGVTLVDHLRDRPGADIITQGIQSTNPVFRGFNNIFSGALHVVTDNRISGLPALRANIMSFVPTTEEDVDRMEMVLGPGSALYGPNTAHGVLHVITRSPLTESGTSLSVTGGQQDLMRGTLRTSQTLGDDLGVKLSVEYFRASEWEHVDPVEVAEAAKFRSDPDFWAQDLMRAAGIDAEEAARRIERIGARDFDIDRVSAELRSDWAVTDDAVAMFKAGVTNASQIELTPLGAAQVVDWRYSFYQARLNWGRFFAQAYLNQSGAGESFLLRNGAPIRDGSRLLSGQVQHGIDLGLRQEFTYGIDYFFTDPRTAGTINGDYEDDDQTTEVGAYLQSETQLTRTLDLVLTGRLDEHSLLDEPIFSPRAALVFEPWVGHALRATYNRAFTVPTALNQFLDLGTPIPDPGAARLGYSIRVQGTGTTGFHFRQPDGGYRMLSPFTPSADGGTTELLPAGDAALFWEDAVQVVAERARGAGDPLDPELVDLLLSLEPTSAEVGGSYLDFVTGDRGPLSGLELGDVSPIRESTHSTFELGYSGLLGERAAVAADLWYSRRRRMVTTVTVQTPFVTLAEDDVESFLVPRLVDSGMTPEEAEAVAAQVAAGIGGVPVGVISTPEVHANGPQLLATFSNVADEIDLWGADFSATLLLSDRWSLSATASFVSEGVFPTPRGPVLPLNAPTEKGSLTLGYAEDDGSRRGAIRARLTGDYPASSGVFEGLACLPDFPEDADPCVESYTLVDISGSTDIPAISGASFQLTVRNVLGEEYRSFPGVPATNRLALVRVRYEF